MDTNRLRDLVADMCGLYRSLGSAWANAMANDPERFNELVNERIAGWQNELDEILAPVG
jgi:hypothetical protein